MHGLYLIASQGFHACYRAGHAGAVGMHAVGEEVSVPVEASTEMVWYFTNCEQFAPLLCPP
jgi:hypothetical protein